MPAIPGAAQGRQQQGSSPASTNGSGSQPGGSSSSPSIGQSSGQESQSRSQAGGAPQSAGSQQGNSNQDNAGDSPSRNSGTQSRFPGDQQSVENGNRDGSSADLVSGAPRSSGSSLPAPSGDYSLDTLPSVVLSGVKSGNTSQDTGAMTAAERAAVLDERLRKGYEAFDGFILSERERAQNESNAAGSVAIGGASGGGGGSPADQPQTLEDAGAPAGVAQSMPTISSGAPSSPPPENFPPPEDIPGGRDDDVVARQLREAATSEPDPVLREALWDEYRNYTGIGEDQ